MAKSTNKKIVMAVLLSRVVSLLRKGNKASKQEVLALITDIESFVYSHS